MHGSFNHTDSAGHTLSVMVADNGSIWANTYSGDRDGPLVEITDAAADLVHVLTDRP